MPIPRIPVAILVTVLASPARAAPMAISIEDALAMAARSSKRVAAARWTTAQARAEVGVARSTYFPQITLNGSYVRTFDSEFEAAFGSPDPAAMMMFSDLPFGRDHAWRATIDASQILWDGRRTAANVDLARTVRELAELAERGELAQVLLAVTEAYYGALLAQRVVAIGDRSVAFAQRTYDEARLGFDQGTRSEFEVLRAQVSRDQERAALHRARGERDIAFVRLRQQLGLRLDQPLVLTSTLGREDVARLAELALGIDRARVERLAVAQARTNLAAARAQLKQARADRWPQLTAVTSYGYVQYPDRFLPERDGWLRNWTVGVNLAFPLFTGFRTTSQIRAARARVSAVAARLQNVAELSAVDARQTAIAVDVAAATLLANTRNVKLAERAHQIAEVRYRQGMSTQLELTDARLALDRAQIAAASAARDLQVARVRQALLPGLPVAEVAIPETSVFADDRPDSALQLQPR